MVRRYLAAPAAKVVATKEDKSFMETDSSKIVAHVAINFYTQGIPIKVPTNFFRTSLPDSRLVSGSIWLEPH